MNPPAPPKISPIQSAPPIPAPVTEPQQAEHTTTTRIPLPPGAQVGEYTIISKLGKGGFGITYRARHTDTGTVVVIKEHMPEGMAIRMPDGRSVVSTTPEKERDFRNTMAEFMEEASVLMGLEHPGIVPILSAFEANGTAYYAMLFVEGEQLSIPKQPTLDRQKKAAEARRIKHLLRSMLLTLEYLEQHNIVHRDIKPENIVVNEENRPILLDFGSARQLQPGKVFSNIYTPEFCAPEQCNAKSDAEMSRNISVRSDLYSLGACFYYLVTRLTPPRADMRTHATPDPYKPLAGRKDLQLYYEPYFLQAIDRALNLDARERWQDAATWRLCIEDGIVPPPRGIMLRMRIYMAIALAVIMVLGGLFVWTLREKEQAEQMYHQSLSFTESLLYDFNTELADLPGATQLQRKLGTNLKNYLDSMEKLPLADNTKTQRALAIAWQNLGDVYAQQGNLEEATNSYRKASQLLEELISNSPTDLRLRYEAAKTLTRRAEIARKRNMLDDGHRLAARAIQLLTEVCRQAPNNPDYHCALGEAMEATAHLAGNSGKVDKRRKSLEDMLSLYRELVNTYPRHDAARKGLAYAQISLAGLFMDLNNYATAQELLTESKKIFYELAVKHPHRLSFQYGLSTAYYRIGELNNRISTDCADDALKSTYDSHAIAAFEQCVRLARQLENMDKENSQYPFQQCRAMAHTANILLRKNELNKAERLSVDTLNKITVLQQAAPNNADYAQVRAAVLRSLALIHSNRKGENAKATQEFAEYRETIRKLLEQSPDNPMLRYMYADALAESATHVKNLGQIETARTWLIEAERCLDKIRGRGKDNNIWATRLQEIRDMLSELKAPISVKQQ